MKYLKSFNEGFFDRFSKDPNKKWSDIKLKKYLKKSMREKFIEMGVWDSSLTPEGKKYEPFVSEMIDEIFPFLSDNKKEKLLKWYMDEVFFYKTEEPSKFEVGDEVYYYFNPIETFGDDKPNSPKFYKDVIKDKLVGQETWSYNFIKNRHDNTDSEGYISGRGQYASRVEEENIDYNLDDLKERISKKRIKDIDVIGD